MTGKKLPPAGKALPPLPPVAAKPRFHPRFVLAPAKLARPLHHHERTRRSRPLRDQGRQRRTKI